MPTSADPHFWNALKERLGALGYVEGRDIVYESRSAEGKFERLPALAEELVRARPDVIVTASTPPTKAARAATASIPIVIATGGDPVKMGVAVSLSRPGGNVTGVSNLSNESGPKLVEFARATLPKLSSVAVLWNPANLASADQVTLETAKQMGMTVLQLRARAPAEIDTVFASVAKERSGAVIVLSDPFLISQREKIASLARAQHVPVFANMVELTRVGGLLSYGPDYIDHFRRAAYFVDRILKGAKPGDLPIEQAATFALVVNSKTAVALGIKIPQEILVRATEVIE
ncbi:MAG TPA: ABC transporter substrate-binding protein [Burkholderiales bacterium]|jgi:putative ABC transport system substrate-binding protein|nr:ABC transporter substrate-binding protein [Burkholderiales bacterium]